MDFTGWDDGGEALPESLEGIKLEGDSMLTSMKVQMQELGRGPNLAGWLDLNRNQTPDLSGPHVCRDPLF